MSSIEAVICTNVHGTIVVVDNMKNQDEAFVYNIHGTMSRVFEKKSKTLDLKDKVMMGQIRYTAFLFDLIGKALCVLPTINLSYKLKILDFFIINTDHYEL